MRKRKNKSTGIYAYLNSLGLLENGSDSQLAAAREKYWRQYKANWIKEKRKQTHLTIYLSEKELRIITKAASTNHRSKTRYLKEAALAYAQLIYLVPNMNFHLQTMGCMTTIIALLKKMLSVGTSDFVLTRQAFDEFLILEAQLKKILNEPLLMDAQWFKELMKDEAKKEYILKLIQTN